MDGDSGNVASIFTTIVTPLYLLIVYSIAIKRHSVNRTRDSCYDSEPFDFFSYECGSSQKK